MDFWWASYTTLPYAPSRFIIQKVGNLGNRQNYGGNGPLAPRTNATGYSFFSVCISRITHSPQR